MTSVFIKTPNGLKEFRVYDHLYVVAKDGEVLREGSPVYPYKGDRGYFQCGNCRLHRMVAACWLKNFENHKHVHHKDFDKSNNHASNLEALTPKQHAERHGGSNLGNKHSPETIEKLRKAALNRPEHIRRQRKGIKHTLETREKMSKNRKKQSCIINGVRYKSFNSAGNIFNISPATIRDRCLSKTKKFQNYSLDE